LPNAVNNKKQSRKYNIYTPLGIIILAAFLLSFSFYINWKLNADTRHIIVHINNINEQLSQNNWSEALATQQKLQKDWDEVKTTWALFTDHQRLDQVSESLIRLYYALLTENIYDTRIELSTVDYLLTNFSEKERLNLKNFF